MASILNTKINSYSLDRGIEFNETYTTTPVRTGSSPLGSFSAPTLKPSYISTDGPIGGAGSWEIVESPTTGAFSYFRGTTATATELAGIQDNDFTVGLWFKFTSLPGGSLTGVSGNLITDAQSGGWSARINGSAATSGLGSKLSIAGSTSYPYTSSFAIIANTWYYLAIRRVGSGTNNYQVFLNGTLDGTFTSSTSVTASSLNFGNSGSTTNTATFRISNYHLAPSSVLNATAISEIYTTGITSPNVSISTQPITASALQTEPVLAIATGSHIEITTSILVSAEFSNSIVLVEKNISNSITIIDSQANLQDQIDISTGSDASFSTIEMTANAELISPLLSVTPFTASAQSGNHIASVTPNYYNLVKSLNPYVYFYDGKTSSTNGGYQSGTFAKGADVTALTDGGLPMNIIGEGKSWYFGITNNGYHQLTFTAPTTAESFDSIIASKTFSIEFWIKPSNNLAPYGPYTRLEELYISEGLQVYRSGIAVGNTNYINGLQIILKNGSSTTYTFQSNSNLLDKNNWHHIVIQGSPSSVGNIQIQAFVDGTAVINSNTTFTTWTPSLNNAARIGGQDIFTSVSAQEIAGITDTYVDQWALYNGTLSNSQILEHYQMISTASPNRTMYSSPMTANIDSGSHDYVVTSNVNFAQLYASAASLFTNTNVYPSKNISINADVCTASGIINDATIYWGWTIYPLPSIAYAESTNAYRLSDIYYNYVQSNIAPYRYVTFDGNNSYLDYGTDNDYAVDPVTVGGTVVNPDFGINGKSAKTAGTSYITDGVILKESEYNDTWGTGLNNYHSSFWMQKSDDDTSTTGLRILWNLNGYSDNQHVILYQYQNKLSLQFNNGSGTYITQTTVSNYNLFDGQRHFVAIAFDHTGNNSYVNLFIDSVDVMQVNLGSYNGTTINGTTPVGANDEANNHPRLSIGCLITPFAATALPVVPTNTKIYVDEIIWAKSLLTQTLATNLFNIMPIKGVSRILATPLEASDEFVMPSILTQAILSTSVINVSSEFVNPIIAADREVVINVDIIDVNANMLPARSTENRIIVSDIFIASAYTPDGVVKITIPGGPMTASAILPKNIKPKSPVSIYMKYLIAKTLVTQQMIREVK